MKYLRTYEQYENKHVTAYRQFKNQVKVSVHHHITTIQNEKQVGTEDTNVSDPTNHRSRW